jgi:glycosyltransferase involved in cell wall biosynthesis
MLEAVARERVDDFLAASDVCLHVLRPDPLFHYALPNKILSYLESHRPFVTNVAGLPERLARESGGAYCASAEELAEELRRWVDLSPAERRRRGEQAFAYGREHFQFEANADRLERLLEDVLAASRRSSPRPAGR